MTMDAKKIWEHSRDLLRETLSKDVFERWISVIHAIGIEGDSLLLGVANDFYSTWLAENYLPLIEKAVRSCSDESLKIRMIVARLAAGDRPAAAAAASAPAPAPAPAPEPARHAPPRHTAKPAGRETGQEEDHAGRRPDDEHEEQDAPNDVANCHHTPLGSRCRTSATLNAPSVSVPSYSAPPCSARS